VQARATTSTAKRDSPSTPVSLCRLFSQQIIKANAETLNKAIDTQRDFSYDYFGFKTLERSYLLKVNKKIVERPQYMLMRVAVGIHKDDITSVIQT